LSHTHSLQCDSFEPAEPQRKAQEVTDKTRYILYTDGHGYHADKGGLVLMICVPHCDRAAMGDAFAASRREEEPTSAPIRPSSVFICDEMFCHTSSLCVVLRATHLWTTEMTGTVRPQRGRNRLLERQQGVGVRSGSYGLMF
jgi:hypothetical protein